jgi:hypothetical protein
MADNSKHPRARPAQGYVSEFEHYLNQYKAEHPDVEEDQRRGWYIWWDHKAEPSAREVRRKDTIPVRPYPYD